MNQWDQQGRVPRRPDEQMRRYVVRRMGIFVVTTLLVVAIVILFAWLGTRG